MRLLRRLAPASWPNFAFQTALRFQTATLAHIHTVHSLPKQVLHTHIHTCQVPCVVLCRAVLGAQVTVDVPWSPYDIDGRSYDFKGLADAADLLFVMMYDTQSQVGPSDWQH